MAPSKPARLVVTSACLLAALVPLAFNPAGFFIFLPVKWALVMALVGAGLAAAVLQGRNFPRNLLICWGPLLVVVTASTAFSISWPTSLIGSGGRNLGWIAWLAFLGAFLLGGAAGSDDEGRQRIILVSVAASILVSVYALAQSAGLDLFEWDESLDLSRSRSTLGSATFLAAYLVLLLPLSFRLALNSGLPPRPRSMCALAAVLAAGALLTTQTRGAWIGAGASLAVLAALERRRIRQRLSAFAAAAAASAALLIILAVVTPVGSRLASIADVESGTARGRLIQWELTLAMVADRPLLGWGPDTYAAVFPSYISSKFERDIGRDVIPDRAHNVFLDIASTLGVLGLVAYLWLLASVFRAALANRRTPLSSGLIAALAGYLVQMFFSFPLADLDSVFWMFVGLAVSPWAKDRPIARVWGYAVAGLTLVAGIWAARDAVADVSVRRGLEYEAAGGTTAAYEEFVAASQIAPERVQYLQAAARFKRREGERSGDVRYYQEALYDIERAQKFSPANPEFALDRADLLLSWGQTAASPELLRRAETAYARVLSNDPNSSRALLKLGVAVVELGRVKEAEKIWLRAYSLAPRAVGPALNLGTLYERSGQTEAAVRYYKEVLRVEPDNEGARSALARLRP